MGDSVGHKLSELMTGERLRRWQEWRIKINAQDQGSVIVLNMSCTTGGVHVRRRLGLRAPWDQLRKSEAHLEAEKTETPGSWREAPSKETTLYHRKFRPYIPSANTYRHKMPVKVLIPYCHKNREQ